MSTLINTLLHRSGIIQNHKISCLVLSLTLLLSGCPLSKATVVPGCEKPAEEWTEKERIGSDVPLEAWRDATSTPWAVLLCIHGLGLYARSFADFGKQMSTLGVPTYAIDVRGFGSWKNTEETSHLDFKATFDDIRNALLAIKRAHPGIPVILLGESMGGAIALQAAAANPELVDGLICSVPSRRRQGAKGITLRTAVGLVYRPHEEIEVGEKVVKRATTQRTLVTEWENDPLSRLKYSPKELLEFQKLMMQNAKKAEQISSMPVLFFQGGNDRLIKPSGTIALFNELQSPDKNLVMVGTAEHLIFEEGQFNDDVIDLVTSWIDKHVAEPKLSSDSSDSSGHLCVVNREALGNFKIAEGNIMLNDPVTAKDHLLAAIRIAKGSNLAARANQLLLTLPEQLLAPPMGRPKPMPLNLVSLDSAKANDKPTILIFCAKWIESCKTILDDVHTALGARYSQVNVVMIDADDPKNDPLLKQYGIQPLPAVLYLNGINEVVDYTLGNPGIPILGQRIEKLFTLEQTRVKK